MTEEGGSETDEGQEKEVLLKPGQVAALFKTSVNNVGRWRKAGKIRYVQNPGGGFRYPASQFREYQELIDSGGKLDG